MVELPVEIVRFVEEHQPPIVEAEFRDATGHSHAFVDKSAIFTTDRGLQATTKYPQPGVIRCEVLGRCDGRDGVKLVRVRTEVESTEGLSEFVVVANQLSSSGSPATGC
jgi:hypothetical protein